MSAADTAGVLGLPLAVASLVAALAAFRKPAEGADADLAVAQARTLARLVAEDEGQVLTQLLGADTKQINLRYALMPATARSAQAPAAGLAILEDSVPLPDIAAYYRDIRPARLVITGAPGAGKTVLALKLLLALAQTRADTDPVPVRVPMAQWNTSVPLRDVLVQRLADAYNRPVAVAANLVNHGLVLPVLDGLDEMDRVRGDGTPDPAAPRARAALEQLSAYQDSGAAGPLVLTCRSAHYDALAPAETLLDAARIVIAPVDIEAVLAYLESRARDLPRWRPLSAYLTAHPASAHAVLLSTPWRLCLTATVYARGGDPAELLSHHTQACLDNHLLARYITAATTVAANPRGYTPAEIHHWLHRLAVHLIPSSGAPARTDIVLHRLWPMVGSTRVRITDAALTTVVCLLVLPLVWSGGAPTPLVALAALVAAVAGIANGRSDVRGPVRLGLRGLAAPPARAAAVRWLAGGLAGGTVFGLILELAGGGVWLGWASGLASALGFGAVFGLPFGLAFGLVFGPIVGFEAVQSPACRPGSTIRQDAQFMLMAGLAAGLPVGLLAGLFAGLLFGSLAGLFAGLLFGLTFGLVFGLVGGPSVGGSAAWRYLVFLLSARGKLPFRLARFLDWGCAAGLLRYSGPAYQFRHRELQLWLAAHPDPVTNLSGQHS